jgi:hypothetical protein
LCQTSVFLRKTCSATWDLTFFQRIFALFTCYTVFFTACRCSSSSSSGESGSVDVLPADGLATVEDVPMTPLSPPESPALKLAPPPPLSAAQELAPHAALDALKDI